VVTSVKIPAGNRRAILAQGRLRMILRLGGQEELVEVGVLRQVVSKHSFEFL
jgi:hypothetical protein